MNLIRLLASQKHGKNFKHPAFDDVKPVPIEKLTEMAEERLMGGPSEPLILALRSTARYLIGRYLWHYPASRRFLDEMVGEALLAITMTVHTLNRDMLAEIHIQKLVSSRIRTRVEVVLNDLQGIAAPCVWTQRELTENGESAIYLESEREPVHEDKEAPDAEEEKSDMLDAIRVLRDECDMANQLLDPDNWGLSDQEVADKLGVTRQCVRSRRIRLLTQFHELTGEEK